MITQAHLKELLLYDPLTGLWTWRIRKGRKPPGSRAGHLNTSGHLQITIEGKLYLSGRLAFFYMTGEWPPETVDHINRVRSDDRWSNLRLASRRENAANSKYPSHLGVKGVYICGPKYAAYILCGDERIHIGTYPTVEEAARMYRFMALTLHGEFATT